MPASANKALWANAQIANVYAGFRARSFWCRQDPKNMTQQTMPKKRATVRCEACIGGRSALVILSNLQRIRSNPSLILCRPQ